MAEGLTVNVDTTNLMIIEDTFKRMSDACLSAKDERGIFIKAFKKAAIPVVDMIKANVLAEATDRGNLFRSIGTKAVPGEASLWIGSILKTPYITKKGRLSTVWYGLLTEGGANNVGRPTVEGKRLKKSELRTIELKRSTMRSAFMGGSLNYKHIEAKHWFSGAWDWGQWQMYDTINEDISTALNDFLVKAESKMKK